MILLSGCVDRKERINYYYFDHSINKNDLKVYLVGQDKGATIAPKDPSAKIGDRIVIRMLGISAVDENIGIGNDEGQGGQPSYLVDGEGMIALPLLGKVRVLGLTRKEISKKLETLYANYVVEPMVEITIVGHSVLLWGDLKGGVYELTKDRTSLIEILTRAGGISTLGKRNAVRVIRTKPDGKKEILIFDLTKIETLDQEELWLQDKDIILIEPKRVKIITENLTPYFNIISLGTSLITITFLIVSVASKKNP